MKETATYSKIATAIVIAQSSVIGPLAFDQAGMVAGISISQSRVVVSGDGKIVLAELVAKFETLFGQASIEVCKDAVREMHLTINPNDLPEVLK